MSASGFVSIGSTGPKRQSRRSRNKKKTAQQLNSTTSINDMGINNENVLQSTTQSAQSTQSKTQPIQSVSSNNITTTTTTTTSNNNNNNNANDVWTQRRKQRQQNNNTKSNNKTNNKSNSNDIKKSEVNKKEEKHSKGGFKPRRIAYTYDPNQVDMNSNNKINTISKNNTINKNNSEQEAYPSLQKSNKNNSNKYKPKRVSTQYDPNSVNMTRKPIPQIEIEKQSIDNNNNNKSLSLRSKGGFKVRRIASDSVHPTSKPKPKSNPTTAPPHVPIKSQSPKNKQISLTKSTKPQPKSKPKPQSKSKPKPQPKSKPKPQPKSKPKPQSKSLKRSPKKIITPLYKNENTKKYLELRKKGNLQNAFIIKKNCKNIHEVASIKTELAKKIALNEEAASNEYYYNKNDMLDLNNNYDFNAFNDKSIEVVAESFNPYDTQQPPAIDNNNIYAQDGLSVDTMLPIVPNNNNIFPGMIPNVPIVTDPIEIAQNAKLAAQSNLKPTIAEFIPGQINNSFVNNQFNATQIFNVQYNTSANIQYQQWINDQNQSRQYRSNRNNQFQKTQQNNTIEAHQPTDDVSIDHSNNSFDAFNNNRSFTDRITQHKHY